MYVSSICSNKKPEKTMKMSRSQCLMGFAMKHFSDASGWTPSNIAICFSMGFPQSSLNWAFPAFFLDKIEKAYNMDPPLAFHQKKFPFRSMCCLLSRVGPLGRVGHCPVPTSTYLDTRYYYYSRPQPQRLEFFELLYRVSIA